MINRAYLHLEGLLLELMMQFSIELRQSTLIFLFQYFSFQFRLVVQMKNNRNHLCIKITDQTRSE